MDLESSFLLTRSWSVKCVAVGGFAGDDAADVSTL